MLIPYVQLPNGSYYIVPGEIKTRLRQKGNGYDGCAFRRTPKNDMACQLHLSPDSRDRLMDQSLMVIQVHVD